MADVVQVLSAILSALGLLLVSALLATVALSPRIHRDVVFSNFLCTCIVWSAFLTFSTIAGMAVPLYQVDTTLIILETMRDVLWVVTQVAMLNLIVHLWFVMKACMHGRTTVRVESLRKVVLLITPYLFGLIPISELFYPVGHIYGVPTPGFLPPLFLALGVASILGDVALLSMFWCHRQILRQADIHGILSMTMLMKLSTFCLYRLILTAFCALPIRAPIPSEVSTKLLSIAESLYPLLVFVLLGFKRDVMHIWFPCLRGNIQRVEKQNPNHFRGSSVYGSTH